MPYTAAAKLDRSIFSFPVMIPEKLRIFASRKEAGQKLALALAGYRGQNPLILAIPPGGAEVGLEVAKVLKGDFSLIISRKLPIPGDPATSFGAVAEDGSTYLHVNLVRELVPDSVSAVKAEQMRDIQRDIATLRKGRDLPNISGRTVILIDDGLIRGSTMKAAFLLCRKRHAARVIVAVPFSGKKVMDEIKWLADEVVALESLECIYETSQVYDRLSLLSDEDVIKILIQWEKFQKKRAMIARNREG